MRLAIIALVAATAACVPRYRGDARRVTPTDAIAGDPRWKRAAPTPSVRQRSAADCGQAALAMVMRRWGIDATLDDLPRSASKKGLTIAALRRLARTRGLDAFVIRGTLADLAHELERGRPVIVGLVRPYTRGRALSHYEVVIAVDPERGDTISIDPGTGKQLHRTAAALDAEWKPAGHATLVVVGAAR
jgi:ABC-type bacteriocin/lantibiotic exporter with double-glycine peptidase domain